MWIGTLGRTSSPGARMRRAGLFVLVALALLAMAAPGGSSASAEPGVPAVSDILVVYQSGLAVGTRMIEADLEAGPNRLVVGPLPEAVNAQNAELAAVDGRVEVKSKFFDPSARCLVFTVVPQSPGPASLRLTYAFSGLTWSASYTIVLDGRWDEAAVFGWYCVSNHTGSPLSPRSMTLVAGHSNVVPGQSGVRGAAALGVTSVGVACPDEMPHGADFYLQAVKADKVPARMVYLVDRIGITQPDPAVYRKEEPHVVLALEMTVSGPELEPPLPGGCATVYARSEDGAAYLLGEDNVAPIGASGSVMVRLGRAPFLRVEKARTDQKKIGTSSWEEAYQIRITNSGSDQADVVILEEFPGEWAVLQSAPVTAARSPSGLARFSLPAPVGRTEVLYRVRYTLQL